MINTVANYLNGLSYKKKCMPVQQEVVNADRNSFESYDTYVKSSPISFKMHSQKKHANSNRTNNGINVKRRDLVYPDTYQIELGGDVYELTGHLFDRGSERKVLLENIELALKYGHIYRDTNYTEGLAYVNKYIPCEASNQSKKMKNKFENEARMFNPSQIREKHIKNKSIIYGEYEDYENNKNIKDWIILVKVVEKPNNDKDIINKKYNIVTVILKPENHISAPYNFTDRYIDMNYLVLERNKRYNINQAPEMSV